MEHIEKKVELPNAEKSKFTFNFQRLNFFKKNLVIQYLILIFWIISAFLYLYYEIYLASTLEMVKLNKLPGDASWFLYTSIIFLVVGIILLLLTPLDQSLQAKEEAKIETIGLVKKVEALLLQKEFSASLDILSSHFEKLKTFGIKENVDVMLDLVKKARINKEVQTKIEKFVQEFGVQNPASPELRKEFLDFQIYINQNRPIILNELLAKADMLARKLLLQS